MTVTGAVPGDTIGFVLPHEHVYIDLVRIHPTQLLAYDFQLLDHALVKEELGRFVKAVEASPWRQEGTPALVELTSDVRMGRDPLALRALSTQLGLHIVMSCGWYREPWFEPEMERRSVGFLADRLVDEIQNGVTETDIRPGIIGELGTDRDFVSPLEERVLRAGARAHHATDLSITLHARASKVALSQLDILINDERVEPHRIIVGHTDTVHEPDYHTELAQLGVWVEFDTIRGTVQYVAQRALRYVLHARQTGFLHQVLVSGDICALSHLRAYGGTGYDYLPSEFASHLRDAGFTEADLHLLFVDNPRKALTGVRPEAL